MQIKTAQLLKSSVSGKLLTLLAVGMLAVTAPQVTYAQLNAPQQKTVAPLSSLSVAGTGASPNARITLNLGQKVAVSSKADKDGNFSFAPIPYDYKSPFTLVFQIPANDGKRGTLVTNQLSLTIRPGSFSVKAEGTGTKAASFALNVGGESAAASIANDTGYFKASAKTRVRLDPAQTNIVASIINVKESCCPRTLTPTEPVMVRLSGNAAPQSTAPKAATTTIAPILPVAPTATDTAPEPATAPGKAKKTIVPPSKPIMMPGDSGELVKDEVTYTASLEVSQGAYAASTSVDDTWVEGLRQITDQIMPYLVMQGRMIGGFIDAKVHLDAQRSLQRLAAGAIKDYTPGEALCGFGTLSRSIAASEGRSYANKRALSEVLIDRETMRRQTANATGTGNGNIDRLRYFRLNFCNSTDEAYALRLFCDGAVSNRDFNKDVDYTRFIDTPLTLNINFADAAPTAAQARGNAEIIAYANNLFANEAPPGLTEDSFKQVETISDDIQNYRALIAARGVVRNSFATLIGMKAPGTASANTYMQNMMTQLGVPAANVAALIGTNPSYFAQMEILTKKIYQDPAFYANLYEKPVNVERQRAAMKGISLQQQTDFLEMLKRREMLLSVLLELKIRSAVQE